jgi:hypothetical protein
MLLWQRVFCSDLSFPFRPRARDPEPLAPLSLRPIGDCPGFFASGRSCLNWPEPTEQRQAIENSFDIASVGADAPGTIFPMVGEPYHAGFGNWSIQRGAR